MQLRRSLIATGAVAVLAVSGVTAAVANDPPPRIAFLANGIVPADALAAGPIAGQLGAPIYTTGPGSLIESTGVALDAYDPDLVIVMGGPAAISDAVLAQVSDVTGLSVEEASPPPTSGIVRAAGQDRFETAAAAAALLGSYDPAFLPTDMQAADSDKLDGKDSSAFQPAGDYLGATEKAQTAGHADTAGDADTLDGIQADEFSLQAPTTLFLDEWSELGFSPDSTDFRVERFANVTRLNNTAEAGTSLARLAVPTPTSIGGASRVEVMDLTLCLDDGASSIVGVDFELYDAASQTHIVDDAQTPTFADSSCTTITPTDPIVIDHTRRFVVHVTIDAGGLARTTGAFLRIQPTDAPVTTSSASATSGATSHTSPAQDTDL